MKTHRFMDKSQYTDIAKRYAEQVISGEILACRWVQAACQRQLDDLIKFKGESSLFCVDCLNFRKNNSQISKSRDFLIFDYKIVA